MQFSTYDQMVDFTESMQGFLSRNCIIKLEEVLIKMSPDRVDSDIFKNKGHNFVKLMKEYNDILILELGEKLGPYIQSLYFQQLVNFSKVLNNSKTADLPIKNPFGCIGCAGLGPSFSCAVCEDSSGFNTCENCEGGVTECEECEGYWEEHQECNDCGGEGQQDCYSCDGDGRQNCDDCEGDGEMQCSGCGGDATVDCDDCDGDGQTECGECEGNGHITCEECEGQEEVDCEGCDGTGVVEDDEGEEENCSECEGNGVVGCDNCEGGYSEECSTCEATGSIKCEGDCDGDGIVTCSDCDGSGHEECYDCNGEGDFECGDCGGGGQEDCEECYGNGVVDCSECDEGYESCFECNGIGVTKCKSCVGIGKGICGSQHPIRVEPNKKFIENAFRSRLNVLEVDAKNPLLIATITSFNNPDYNFTFFPKNNSYWRLYLVYNGWVISLFHSSTNPVKIIKKESLISLNLSHLTVYKSNNASLSNLLRTSHQGNWVYYIYLKSTHPFINWEKMPWEVK